jgi:hypothetical protein
MKGKVRRVRSHKAGEFCKEIALPLAGYLQRYKEDDGGKDLEIEDD